MRQAGLQWAAWLGRWSQHLSPSTVLFRTDRTPQSGQTQQESAFSYMVSQRQHCPGMYPKIPSWCKRRGPSCGLHLAKLKLASFTLLMGRGKKWQNQAGCTPTWRITSLGSTTVSLSALQPVAGRYPPLQIKTESRWWVSSGEFRLAVRLQSEYLSKDSQETVNNEIFNHYEYICPSLVYTAVPASILLLSGRVRKLPELTISKMELDL